MTKSVLITGATRGLGENLARQFAERGYRLALTGRSLESLQQLADDLQSQAAQVVVKQLDVSEFDTIAGVIRECATELGGLDIVIVNAGVGFATPVGKSDFDRVRTVIDVNLTAAIATTAAAVELFREQGRGQVVGITSVAGARGQRNMGAYCASKAGFSRYLESVRCETLKQRHRRHRVGAWLH